MATLHVVTCMVVYETEIAAPPLTVTGNASAIHRNENSPKSRAIEYHIKIDTKILPVQHVPWQIVGMCRKLPRQAKGLT